MKETLSCNDILALDHEVTLDRMSSDLHASGKMNCFDFRAAENTQEEAINIQATIQLDGTNRDITSREVLRLKEDLQERDVALQQAMVPFPPLLSLGLINYEEDGEQVCCQPSV